MSLYKQYVDDTLLIWPHGHETLAEFVTFLNNRHEKIKSTVEIEQGERLPLLDTMLIKHQDGRTCI